MMPAATGASAQMRGGVKPKAVLFDLLTALMDSWTLWDTIAGNVIGPV